MCFRGGIQESMDIKEKSLTISCLLCHKTTKKVFDNIILNKYSVGYYQCKNCGFLFTEKPYWLDEAYSSAISNMDTGLVQRNLEFSKKIAVLFFLLYRGKGKFLDLAGGTGLFVRIMRDIGFDYFWQDPYCDNVHAVNFERSPNDKFLAITALEVLEHLDDPVTFLNENIVNTNTETFVFSTELFQGPAPSPSDWWYYTSRTGQHISFYQEKSLRILAAKMEMNFYSHGGIHIFTKKKINKLLLKICLSRLSSILCIILKRYLKSRTVSDYHLIMNKDNEK